MTAVREGGVALALIDLQLPGSISGLDLYERWQAEGLDVPAILVTGHADQAVVIRALRTGFRDFVPKSSDFIEYLGNAVDRVMAQIRVERKLAESELRLASVIGTTLDAILMCDATGRVVLSNESAQQMFGCSAAELAEQRVSALIPGLTLSAARVAPGRFRERRELEALRGGAAGRLPIEVSVTDVVIDQQRLFTVIARDITERRRAEEERREADRRKDEFLGMLGHELRNPLAAIMSAGEVLHQRLGDDPMRKLTEVVRRQSKSLARMVDDLLDMSRVTLGKIDLSRHPMLLGTAVMQALESVRDRAATALVKLTADVDAEPVWIHGDPTRLEQVLTNLLTNAIKFTPQGGVVTIAAGSDGSHAVVTVTDTGIGMPPELVPRVFDLFVQGDSTLDRARSGLGIGLALVHQIVVMHGGTVSAASAGPDRGSTFTVRIPLAPQDVRPEEEPPESVRASTRRQHILVVDDQRDVADTLAALIEGLGHEVRVVYDASEALDLARRVAVDVIIADIGMPGMSGYDLAQSVRRDPALQHVRLIALTGYGRDEDHARVAAAGFDLHLTKPVADGALQAALNRLPVSSVTPRA
jgi:PAS domain S-box-containing protein